VVADPASHDEDPIRTEVERSLRLAFEAAFALPMAATARLQRCARSGFDRFGWDAVGDRILGPLRLLRSLADATVTTSVVAPVDDELPTPIVAPPLEAESVPARRTRRPAAPARSASDALPIEEYENLAASHVVARLAQLTPPELRRVQAFESAHRGRRTVLGRIEQLLAGT